MEQQQQQHLSPARPDASRANTWPSFSDPASKPDNHRHLDLLNLDHQPEQHFLSPTDMDDYKDWSSDSDDDDDEVEWSAGITDFALFDQDRQQAKASGQAIPEKWGTMLSSQASALSRAVERSRHSQTPSTDSMPDLTPDVSPHLRDDLDIGSHHAQIARPVVPAYLGSVASFSRHLQPRQTYSSLHILETKPRRPGLRDGRTLSGREHVWRRPSWDIFTVREDSVAELKAEHGNNVSPERQAAAISDYQLALLR